MNLLRPALSSSKRKSDSKPSSLNPFSDDFALVHSDGDAANISDPVSAAASPQNSEPQDADVPVAFGEPSTDPFECSVVSASTSSFAATDAAEALSKSKLEKKLLYIITGKTSAREYAGLDLHKVVTFQEVLLLHHFLTLRFSHHAIYSVVVPPPPVIALEADDWTLHSVKAFLARVFSHPVLRADPNVILFWKTRYRYAPNNTSFKTAHRFYTLQLELIQHEQSNVAASVKKGKPDLSKPKPLYRSEQAGTASETNPPLSMRSSTPTPPGSDAPASKYYDLADIDHQMRLFGQQVEQLLSFLKKLEKASLEMTAAQHKDLAVLSELDKALGGICALYGDSKDTVNLLRLASKCFTPSQSNLLLTLYQFTWPLACHSIMWCSASAALLLEKRLQVLSDYDQCCKRTLKRLQTVKSLKSALNISPLKVDDAIKDYDEATRLEAISRTVYRQICKTSREEMLNFQNYAVCDLKALLLHYIDQQIHHSKLATNALQSINLSIN